MRIFKNILDFYLESSLHVAFAVYALIRVTFFKLNIPYDEPLASFGFFGTIVGYNFIKYDELARIKRVRFSSEFKAIIALSFVSFLASFYYFLQLCLKTQLMSVFVLLITILYALPLFPKRDNMRNWSGLKIYIVALAWVGVTVLLPVINAGLEISLLILLKCLQRFLFVFVLMLLFEIVDLQFDAIPLKTIPQKIGLENTKKLSYVLILFFLILERYKSDTTLCQFKVVLLISFLLVILTYFINNKKNKYYSSFWVESIPIVWFSLLCFC